MGVQGVINDYFQLVTKVQLRSSCGQRVFPLLYTMIVASSFSIFRCLLFFRRFGLVTRDLARLIVFTQEMSLPFSIL